MKDLVSEDKVHDALVYLASTDLEAANARAKMDGLKAAEKTIIGCELLKQQGTVPEKEAKARNSIAYKDWLEDFENSAADWFLLQNKRSTAVVIVDCWRTHSSNVRKGNI